MKTSRRSGKLALHADQTAFFEKWRCDLPELDKDFRKYASDLFEKKPVEDVAGALSFIDELEGIDRILFMRILATSCRHHLHVLRDPDWLWRREQQVRKNLKAHSDAHKRVKQEISRGIESLSTRLQPNNLPSFGVTPGEYASLLKTLAKVKDSPFFRGRLQIYERAYLNLAHFPSDALFVYLLDVISHEPTISEHRLKSLETLFRIWHFPITRAVDDDATLVGRRLRQRYRIYQHRYSFSLTRKGYDIASI
jgi:hypothetical protein